MIRRLAFAAAGLVWGWLVFLVAFHVTFPSDAAILRLKYEAAERSGKAWSLAASDASLWRFTGLELEDFQLLKTEKPKRRARSGEEEEPADARVFLEADSLAVRLRLLPLIRGRKDVGFTAHMHGGSLDGHVGLGETSFVLDTSIDDIDLSTLDLQGKDFEADLQGTLGGMLDLDLDQEDLSASTGEGSLEIQDLVMVKTKVMGFDLPENQKFTEAKLAFKVENGKAKITDGKMTGDLIEAVFEGEITLNKKLLRSRPRIEITFTVAEAVDNLLKIAPGPKDARDDEGKYHFLLTGTLEHPRFYPDRAKTGRSARSTRPERVGSIRRPDTTSAGTEPGGEEADMDEEERRKAREDRIRERRERLRERRERLKSSREEGGDGRVAGPPRDRGRDDMHGPDEDLPDEPSFPHDPPEPPEPPLDDDLMDPEFLQQGGPPDDENLE